MSDLRSTLLGSARVKREPLTLTIDGASLTVEVRGITAGARGRLLNGARTEDGSMDWERYFAQLVIESTFDPATEQPLFGAADLDAVNALPVAIVEELAGVAQRLSGLGAAMETIEGNSAATASAATASASPSA